ncbi:MAG TPA: hypothetical protein VFS21_15960 [Roseiflexaceae bacterium]|nr:hypothetical protein [Roseiflexaceae bacterium]
MALIKKKTRKQLVKRMRKLMKKHGSEVVTGLVSTLMTAAAAKLSTNDDSKKHKKNKKHAALPAV